MFHCERFFLHFWNWFPYLQGDFFYHTKFCISPCKCTFFVCFSLQQIKKCLYKNMFRCERFYFYFWNCFPHLHGDFFYHKKFWISLCNCTFFVCFFLLFWNKKMHEMKLKKNCGIKTERHLMFARSFKARISCYFGAQLKPQPILRRDSLEIIWSELEHIWAHTFHRNGRVPQFQTNYQQVVRWISLWTCSFYISPFFLFLVDENF